MVPARRFGGRARLFRDAHVMRRSHDLPGPPSSEIEGFGDEIRRLFDEIERTIPPGRWVQGECAPALDVLETRDAIEIVIDLPGVPGSAVRILIKDGVAIVAGQKPLPVDTPPAPASFHLVERTFGRFVRAVRIVSAFDASRVLARLRAGELHLVLPKIEERRGGSIAIPIEVE